MGIYKWIGVDIAGQFQKGKMYARSIAELDAQLLHRSVALTRARPTRTLIRKKYTGHETARFYASMATLLHAGLKVPEALEVVVQSASKPEIAQLYDRILSDVVQGARLADACGKQMHGADQSSIAMILAGESSGKLAVALNANYRRLHALHEFKSLTRNALLMPMITLGAFVTLLLFVFLWLIPLMQQFLTAVHELPLSTRMMIAISSFLRQPKHLLIGSVTLGICGILLSVGSRMRTIRDRLDAAVLRLPFFGPLLVVRERAIVFDILKLLHMQGIEMLQALSIARASISYKPIAHEFALFESAVSAGSSLHQACAGTLFWYDPEIAGLLLVGERSGTLHDSLEHIVQLQRAELSRKLKVISIVAQPLVITVLGGVIAVVIVSVYLPLLQMPNVISGW